MQIARVSVLGLILLLMHWQHQRTVSSQLASGLESVPLEQIQAFFPEATGLGDPDPLGGRFVMADETKLGSVLQTFPQSRKYLGFSGPTNTLVAFDPAGNVLGMAILSSLDTRDHIDLIRQDPRFFSALNGKTASEAASARVEAVTGATLTSLAILQGVQARLGAQPGSLKFPEEYTVEDARRLFPEAADVKRDSLAPELWLVSNEKSEPIGYLLSNSPVGDEIVGYQGPTLAYLGMQLDGKIGGLVIGRSFDNEPYVGYARGDEWFSQSLNKKTVEELAKTTIEESRIEGVSGATMTSQAAAEGLLLAAKKIVELRSQKEQEVERSEGNRWKLMATLTLLAVGLLMGTTQLRGWSLFRKSYQILLIGVLGLINADLLSMAMFVGWAQSGIPWQNALGLVCLTIAALLLPLAAKQNLYCDHLCPHGAVQQLLPRRWKLKKRPRWLIALLTWIRPVLLALIVMVPLLHLRVSLVDLEPFDAYAWRAAGIATISVAVVGIVASLFLPMGYCQYGCPTGAVLGYLRRHGKSGEFSRGDGLALALLVLAAICFWSGR